jgi:hypothetical protein
MELSNTGSVVVQGFNARFTAEGKWLVSRLGRTIGSVDSLEEVEPLIDRYRERVRARLVDAQRENQRRKESQASPEEKRATLLRKVANFVERATAAGH